MSDPIVIVGGSLAGYKAAEELRLLGADGPITIIGSEVDGPYDRPPLSKSYLKPVADADELQLYDAEELAELSLDVVSGTTVDRIDPALRRVYAGRQDFPYGQLLIASGCRARRPLWYRDIPGVHVLRSREDATALRNTLLTAQHLAVVGGGFIGTEVAATATMLGIPVTLLVAGLSPLRTLGGSVAGALVDLHQSRGVNIRSSVAVREILGTDGVSGVLLDSGEILECDAVLVAVGAVPNDEWCVDSGLRHPDGGVMCAVDGRASEHVWAAGDVVAGSKGHWATAVAQAKTAARGLLSLEQGRPAELSDIPYFWTDQYSVKIQVVGHHSPDREAIVVRGTLESLDFLAIESVDGRVSAALAANRPQDLAKARLAIKRRMSFEEALKLFSPSHSERSRQLARRL